MIEPSTPQGGHWVQVISPLIIHASQGTELRGMAAMFDSTQIIFHAANSNHSRPWVLNRLQNTQVGTERCWWLHWNQLALWDSTLIPSGIQDITSVSGVHKPFSANIETWSAINFVSTLDFVDTLFWSAADPWGSCCPWPTYRPVCHLKGCLNPTRSTDPQVRLARKYLSGIYEGSQQTNPEYVGKRCSCSQSWFCDSKYSDTVSCQGWCNSAKQETSGKQ